MAQQAVVGLLAEAHLAHDARLDPRVAAAAAHSTRAWRGLDGTAAQQLARGAESARLEPRADAAGVDDPPRAGGGQVKPASRPRPAGVKKRFWSRWKSGWPCSPALPGGGEGGRGHVM